MTAKHKGFMGRSHPRKFIPAKNFPRKYYFPLYEQHYSFQCYNRNIKSTSLRRSSVPFLGRGVPSQINGRMNILTPVPILLIRGMRKACMKTLIGKG